MKRFAFTLAEVLITLGIIGVVAALTLPSLIQNRSNKELETALKKNYSVLQSALAKANYEYGETITPLTANNLKVKNYLMKQLNSARDCQFKNCIDYTSEETESGDILSFFIKEYKTYNKKQNINSKYFDDGQFILNDGSLYMLENSMIWGSEIFITIDVNGPEKKPNAWGHDLFTFEIIKNGKLLPMGAEGTRYKDENIYCSYTSNDRLNGIGCTHKALNDKNYWKNLP